MIDIHPFDVRARDYGHFDFFKFVSCLLEERIIPFSCGRAAVLAALRFWGLNRTDEVLVPPFLCYSLVSAMGRVSFPVTVPSRRTKALLVYHQFGFPQDIVAIEQSARRNKWHIINDCANTIYTKFGGRYLANWGDVGILSFSKLYPVLLGGGLLTKSPSLRRAITVRMRKVTEFEKFKVKEAFEVFKRYHRFPSPEGLLEIYESQGVLPEIAAPFSEIRRYLPFSPDEIQKDIRHRRQLWEIVSSLLPKATCCIKNTDLVPFAIPVRAKEKILKDASSYALRRFQLYMPVLHFDFNCNMLKPNYQKALVIGCHPQWQVHQVEEICLYLQRKIK